MRKAGLDLLKPNAGESILEIGFGTGHTLVSLAKAVGPKGKVFGLDLSDQMAKLAKENLAKAGLLDRAKVRCGDATQLPYAASSMDGVFMSFTLELFDTPEIPKVLSECQRVLRPGGRIVVVGMSKDRPEGPAGQRIRVDAQALSKIPGLPPHLRSPRAGGGWIHHPQSADQTHVDSRRNRPGREGMSVQ